MPKSIQITAPAKINLCLDILKKSPSGYHELQSIFLETPEISDQLTITESKQDSIKSRPRAPQNSDHPTAPNSDRSRQNNDYPKTSTTEIPPKENLAFQALKLLKQHTGISKSAEIHIEKSIPIQSGLGGGSSNAAATLKALNQLWQLKLSQEELAQLAAQLGCDVPFFIYGGTALGTNYGEKITPLPDIRKTMPQLKFQIHPRSGQSTKEAFSQLELSLCGHNIAKTKEALTAIKNVDPEKLLHCLHNDFETLPQFGHMTRLSNSSPRQSNSPSLKIGDVPRSHNNTAQESKKSRDPRLRSEAKEAFLPKKNSALLSPYPSATINHSPAKGTSAPKTALPQHLSGSGPSTFTAELG